MSAITYTVRCKDCPECRQMTLQPGEKPTEILAAMDEHRKREHGDARVGIEQEDSNQ